MSVLFDSYKQTKDELTRAALIHLIKNGGNVLEEEEDLEELTQRLLKKKKAIEQLEQQLTSSLPKGRDLTGQKFLETLDRVTKQIPADGREMQRWNAELLRQPNPLPYPIEFGSNQDLYWSYQPKQSGKSQKVKQQICIRFHGLSTYIFNIQGDRRQLPYFQRFVEDWQNSKKRSGSVFLLRSATLLWRCSPFRRHKHQQEPWNVHVLYLHC